MMKKTLCLCMALVLALGCCAALAEEDLQAQLDAANAKIAELQAQVDAYYPYYIAQLAATYGEDGVIWLKDIMAEYEAVAAQYANFGMDLAAYGMESFVKKDILDSNVEQKVVLAKAAELGLDQFDEETIAGFEATAQATYDGYVDYYMSYYYPDAEEITEEMIAEADAYLAASSMGMDVFVQSEKDSATFEAVHSYVTKDVEVTEEDIQASYQALIEKNKADYADERTYNNDLKSGATIAWQPEGYRSVKHVLIKFDDEQNARYTELQNQLKALNAEKDAIDNPVEPAEGEEPVEPAEGEEPVEPRAIEEINSDIAACATEIEALYSQLMPEAEEVIEAFNAGTSFEELIEKHNDDPGMQNEPTASTGYAVAATSTIWDPAFTAGAMSIANKGEISAPVRGSYGVHVIYYFDDVPAGEVALEDIREEITAMATDAKIESTYAAAVDAWLAEMNVQYYYENLGITA